MPLNIYSEAELVQRAKCFRALTPLSVGYYYSGPLISFGNPIILTADQNIFITALMMSLTVDTAISDQLFCVKIDPASDSDFQPNVDGGNNIQDPIGMISAGTGQGVASFINFNPYGFYVSKGQSIRIIKNGGGLPSVKISCVVYFTPIYN